MLLPKGVKKKLLLVFVFLNSLVIASTFLLYPLQQYKICVKLLKRQTVNIVTLVTDYWTYTHRYIFMHTLTCSADTVLFHCKHLPAMPFPPSHPFLLYPPRKNVFFISSNTIIASCTPHPFLADAVT